MRKKIRSRLAHAAPGLPGAVAYVPGEPLSDDQARNLRFRSDTLAPDGCRAVFRDDAERERAWQEHRERLLAGAGLGRRCAAFWQYEPGVPDALREYPPVTAYASLEAAAAAHARISGARDAWLLEHRAHHRPGERLGPGRH